LADVWCALYNNTRHPGKASTNINGVSAEGRYFPMQNKGNRGILKFPVVAADTFQKLPPAVTAELWSKWRSMDSQGVTLEAPAIVSRAHSKQNNSPPRALRTDQTTPDAIGSNPTGITVTIKTPDEELQQIHAGVRVIDLNGIKDPVCRINV
jgi:hypothetical protein